jgi:copper homeostasis protein CutC
MQSTVQVMREDMAAVAELGVHGVAVGMLTREGDIDEERLSEFLFLCKSLVLHHT